MSSSTWAAITNYHVLSGLKNICFTQCQRLSKILVLGGGPLPGLQMATFFDPHIAGSRERNKFSPVSSYEGTNPILRAPPSLPKTSQRPHLQISSHWGLSVISTYGFWGDTNMQSITKNFQYSPIRKQSNKK